MTAAPLERRARETLAHAMAEAAEGQDFRRLYRDGGDGSLTVAGPVEDRSDARRRLDAEVWRAGGGGRWALVTDERLDGGAAARCEAYDLDRGESVAVVQPYRREWNRCTSVGPARTTGAAEPLPSVGGPVCASCAATMQPGMRFCTACGAALALGTESAGTESAGPGSVGPGSVGPESVGPESAGLESAAAAGSGPADGTVPVGPESARATGTGPPQSARETSEAPPPVSLRKTVASAASAAPAGPSRAPVPTPPRPGSSRPGSSRPGPASPGRSPVPTTVRPAVHPVPTARAPQWPAPRPAAPPFGGGAAAPWPGTAVPPRDRSRTSVPTAVLVGGGVALVAAIIAIAGLVAVRTSSAPTAAPATVELPASSVAAEPDDPTDTTSSEPSAASDPTSVLGTTAQTDSARVEALTGSWVPQLSAKRDGLVADGQTYDAASILALHQSLVARYPSAVLLWSGDYSTYLSGDFWVTVEAEPFSTPDAANAWCDAQGFPATECYAKLLSHTAPPTGSTRSRGN